MGADETARPTNKIIAQRFHGFGIVIAPENPDVFLNRRCREAREVKAGGLSLYCEWHVKLEPHRNRIHVHPPIPTTDNKFIVGVIDEHLILPGDRH